MGSTNRAQAPSDNELLEQVRNGHPSAFDPLYRRHYPVVLAFLSKRVAEPEAAADLLAEAFAALFALARAADRPLPPTPVAWLMVTARNLVIDSYRRGQVESAARRRLGMRPIFIEDRDIERVHELTERTSVIDELEKHLSPDELHAVCARVLDERAYPSIARELNCSEAVIRKRVSRALRTLRNDALEASRNA